MIYGQELRNSIVQRILPPQNQSISKLSNEYGISKSSLHQWMRQALIRGSLNPDTCKKAIGMRTENKLMIVVEIASMNGVELAEFCRTKGLYVEEVKSWRDACMQANDGVAKPVKQLQKELNDKTKETTNLTKALRRKEAALAETAALLV